VRQLGCWGQGGQLLATAGLPCVVSCDAARAANHHSLAAPHPCAVIHFPGPCRRGADGGWHEDAGYTALLGAGWSLEGVREACYRALATVGKDAMHFRWVLG
jgi:hypothetical protein